MWLDQTPSRHSKKVGVHKGKFDMGTSQRGQGRKTNAPRKAEFDKFADEYLDLHANSISASGEGPEYFARYKIVDVRRELDRAVGSVERLNILDFGGGIGASIPHLRELFPSSRIVCADPSAKSLKIARDRFRDAAEYVELPGETMPFDDEIFDVVFTACVFHHIEHEEHGSILSELRRILKPNGRLFLFEHNPLNPLTMRAVKSCPYDENARLISGPRMRSIIRQAGFSQLRLVYRIFFPRLLAALRPLEQRMTWLPMGAQYYIAGTKL
jgi:ubiquinone/menaquinone biosynthesis C-methylase UbiE